MSEEEIIKVLKQVIEPVDIEHMSFYEIYKNYVPLHKLNEAIQGLLDLYQKEKELSLIRFKNLVKIQEEKIEIYNKGYFEGVKDEQDNTNEHIKEIIYPTPENPISLEIQCSEMYKKLLKLLEERN